MRLLTGLLALNIGSNFAQIVLTLWRGNNMIVFHLYPMIAYTLIAIMFSYWARGAAALYIRLTIPIFIIISLIPFFKGVEALEQPNKLALSLMSILVALITLYTLYMSSQNPMPIPFYHDARYWVSLGAFMYYSGSILVFAGIADLITKETWHIHNGLAVIGNMLYIGAYLEMRKWTTLRY